jgi:hypothetical protein
MTKTSPKSRSKARLKTSGGIKAGVLESRQLQLFTIDDSHPLR